MKTLARLARGLGACVLTAATLAYMPITVFVVVGVIALFFADRRIR